MNIKCSEFCYTPTYLYITNHGEVLLIQHIYYEDVYTRQYLGLQATPQYGEQPIG